MDDKRRLIQMFTYLVIIVAFTTVQCASPRWEPQIAVLCEAEQVYQPQYLSEDGRWITDLSKKLSGSTCLRDKLDLLNYCKKIYPNRDITNIVESSHYQKIGSWCRQGVPNAAKCKGAHRWIKPFRCLEGPFQSDALLVPEGCLFDHIHNATRCWPFVRWNQTGSAACQERGMQMRSFAMLLPCGISLFSGVEFVCCPKHFKIGDVRIKKTDLPALQRAVISTTNDDIEDIDDDTDSYYAKESSDDGEDDDIDDDFLSGEEEEEEEENKMSADELTTNVDDSKMNEYDSTEDNYDESAVVESWDQSSSSNGANIDVSEQMLNKVSLKPQKNLPKLLPTTGQPTPDPYFTHFDPHYEHQSYKEAQQRLEESHREKVTRVMKDWSDLEEKYQDMRLADPKAAQNFKQRMTARFQTSVQALEEEGNAEKHQLAAMHQQRVLAHINQRKREAMTCYTQALTEQPPNAHHVEKCLQKLLRALHKDRAHALAHYRHLLNSGGTGGLEAAASERPRTLERLIDIDRAVNQSMTMLKRYPELSAKISQLMNDYILALRSKDDIPGSSLGMSEEAEATILNKYRIEIERKVAEKERLRLAEKQRKEQRAAEREKLRGKQMRLKAQKVDEMLNSDQDLPTVKSEEVKNIEQKTDETYTADSIKVVSNGKNSNREDEMETTTSIQLQTVLPTVDDEAVQRAVEDVAAAVAHQNIEPKIQHFMSHDLSHHESGFSLRNGHALTTHSNKEGRNIYFTLLFSGIALITAIFIAVAVAKWRTLRSPHGKGFIEVEQNAINHHPKVAEENIVPNMQINGYENPTYKYFEVKE